MKQSTGHNTRVFFSSWLTSWLVVMILSAGLLAWWNTSSFVVVEFIKNVWENFDDLTPYEKLVMGAIYFVGWGSVFLSAKRGLHTGFVFLFAGLTGILGSVLLTGIMALVVSSIEWFLWLLCGLIGGLVFAFGIRNTS